MKERPILFSTPMVQALLAGNKTQTRRPVKQNLKYTERRYVRFAEPGTFHVTEDLIPTEKDPGFVIAHRLDLGTTENMGSVDFIKRYSPYGQVGDVLWVRETWAKFHDEYVYRADTEGDETIYSSVAKSMFGGWKPSIHMPKDACRLRLRITDIRLEQLQDISEADSIAEGVASTMVTTACSGADYSYRYQDYSRRYDIHHPLHKWTYTTKHSYQTLWEKINGRGSWSANPWVWVISFERFNS